MCRIFQTGLSTPISGLRMTQMPTVLTEQAYIILPQQKKCSSIPNSKKSRHAIVNGIKTFIKRENPFSSVLFGAGRV